MLSNKRALVLVALLIISVAIKSTLSSPTAQNSRSITLNRRQTPEQLPPAEKNPPVPPKIPEPVPAAPNNPNPPVKDPPAKDQPAKDTPAKDVPAKNQPTKVPGPTKDPVKNPAKDGKDPTKVKDPKPITPNPPQGNIPKQNQNPQVANQKAVDPAPDKTDPQKAPPLSTITAINTAITGTPKLTTFMSVMPESKIMVTRTLDDGRTTVIETTAPKKTVVVVAPATNADGLEFSSTISYLNIKIL